MPNIDPDAKAWQLEWAGRIGRAVQDRRKQLGLTALQLSARTEVLGYPISRVAISKIESNSRAGKVDVAEVAVLGMALDIPPVMLLYPGLPHSPTRLVPMWEGSAIDALLWFTGETINGVSFDDHDSEHGLGIEGMQSARQPLDLSREFWRADSANRAAIRAAKMARADGDVEAEEAQMGYAERQLELRNQILSVMRSLGFPIASEYAESLDAANFAEMPEAGLRQGISTDVHLMVKPDDLRPDA